MGTFRYCVNILSLFFVLEGLDRRQAAGEDLTARSGGSREPRAAMNRGRYPTLATLTRFIAKPYSIRPSTVYCVVRKPNYQNVTDPRYSTWPTPSAIPFLLDATYSKQDIFYVDFLNTSAHSRFLLKCIAPAERSMIIDALNQVAADMSHCIGFVERGSPVGADHLYISKTLNTGAADSSCSSFPGRATVQNGRGQKVLMFSGPTGCLGSKRETMKYIVHSLGLRNEYNRPDRDNFIQVFPDNLRPDLKALNVLAKYSLTAVDISTTSFDFNSITIPSPDKLAVPNSALFIPNASGVSFGTLARLSLSDCQALSFLYPASCRVSACADPYSGQSGSAQTPTVPAGSIPIAPALVAPPIPIPLVPVLTGGPLEPGSSPALAVGFNRR
ncbi:hypothetical protein RvY_00919-1 [Ramazzottius varieornatus]|uniref:Peptidase M12A domain-containing protein n=1 Tax=Ramazzottius varieornatus TaxID=947166 RepID=A0A1D1UEG6_RAMVA|nr:hypothetical protein RvY_00919-1 [Ramazzottius varieornatus]